MYGLREAFTIQCIENSEIEIIQRFARAEAVSFLDEMYEPTLSQEELIYFFGQFWKTPQCFKFMPGEIILISGIINHVKTKVEESGLCYFACDMDEDSDVNDDYFKTINAYQEKVKACVDRKEMLKNSLMTKYAATVETYKRRNESFNDLAVTENMVEVSVKGKRVHFLIYI